MAQPGTHCVNSLSRLPLKFPISCCYNAGETCQLASLESNSARQVAYGGDVGLGSTRAHGSSAHLLSDQLIFKTLSRLGASL